MSDTSSHLLFESKTDFRFGATLVPPIIGELVFPMFSNGG